MKKISKNTLQRKSKKNSKNTPSQKNMNKKNHPQKSFKKCFQKSLLTYGNAKSLFWETRIILLLSYAQSYTPNLYTTNLYTPPLYYNFFIILTYHY